MLDDEKQKKYGNRPLTQEQKVGLLEEELINMKRQRWKLQTGGELMGYPEMLNYINHTLALFEDELNQLIRQIQEAPEKTERSRPDKAKLCGFKTIADRDNHICQRVNEFLKSGYQKTTAYLEVGEELNLSYQQIGKIYNSGE